jgi:hypothetical protein
MGTHYSYKGVRGSVSELSHDIGDPIVNVYFENLFESYWFSPQHLKLVKDTEEDNLELVEDEIDCSDNEELEHTPHTLLLWLLSQGFVACNLDDMSGGLIDWFELSTPKYEVTLELNAAKTFEGDWNFVVGFYIRNACSTIDFKCTYETYQDVIKKILAMGELL